VANHLGLDAEETAADGSLISAAVSLDRALGDAP
jgi:hypothetical protein